jgi:uncharacterized protein DUF1629
MKKKLMKVFRLEILGNNKDKTLAFINDAPDGVGLHRSKLARGGRIGENYPKNAKIQLQPRKPGRKLCSFIGNTQSMLVVSTAVKDLLVSASGADLEVLKFTLYDQKNRELSTDYWIVNPIGHIDCVDRSASEIEYLDEPGDAYHGKVVGVDKFVLDGSKVEKAPSLFRVPEDRAQYFFKEPLADEIRKQGFTNFVLEEIALV